MVGFEHYSSDHCYCYCHLRRHYHCLCCAGYLKETNSTNDARFLEKYIYAYIFADLFSIVAGPYDGKLPDLTYE